MLSVVWCYALFYSEKHLIAWSYFINRDNGVHTGHIQSENLFVLCDRLGLTKGDLHNLVQLKYWGTMDKLCRAITAGDISLFSRTGPRIWKQISSD